MFHTFKGSLVLATCGGIFRNSNGATLSGFSLRIGSSLSIHADLISVMTSTEVDYCRDLQSF